ncbi:tripartite motif-containing protein 3-like [Littorina saxatilis]|uniref:RING-type domain-containing protein n=1 Tax=Littorina saxatilis TaxID=31220 RepID=A0AAN9G242_9CAEN
MASNLSQPDGAKRFTDCPHCGSLCLGPAILPCGHVTCKRCLGHLLQNKKRCPVCKTSLPVQSEDTVSQLAQRFSSELVLHDLVNERLHDLGQQSCEVCQNRNATMICQDCGEMYCDGCASAHRKMRATKEHVQQTLPHTLYNAPPANRPPTGTRRKQHPPSSSTVSGDSITNLPRAPTTRTKLDRQWIEQQVQLFKKAICDVKKVARAAQNFMTLAQELSEDAKGKEEILNIYTNRLESAELRKDSDGHICVSGLSDDDVTATVKTQDLLPRLRDVRESCGQFDVMNNLQTELSGLVSEHKADNLSRTSRLPLGTKLRTKHDDMSKAENIGTVSSKSFDPMTATVRCVLKTTAKTDQDAVDPNIADIVTTPEGQLVLLDDANNMIKIVRELSSQHQSLYTFKLNSKPLAAGHLSDGLLAVSFKTKVCYLLDVSAARVTVKSQFTTRRQYVNVTRAGDHDADKLLVTCDADFDGPASVDIIRRDGGFVRTVTDASQLRGLTNITKIWVDGNNVFIPATNQDCVYRVEISSGKMKETIKHPDLRTPTHVEIDADGNVYIACFGSQCVLVRNTAGKWRTILTGSQRDTLPCALGLAERGIAVVWWIRNAHEYKFASVAGYEFV